MSIPDGERVPGYKSLNTRWGKGTRLQVNTRWGKGTRLLSIRDAERVTLTNVHHFWFITALHHYHWVCLTSVLSVTTGCCGDCVMNGRIHVSTCLKFNIKMQIVLLCGYLFGCLHSCGLHNYPPLHVLSAVILSQN